VSASTRPRAREQPLELHDDLPAHGQAAEHETIESEVVEQRGDAAREGLQHRLARHDRALPVAAKVWGDHPPSSSAEVLTLRSPHRSVERVSVDEHQRFTAALVVVPGSDPAEGKGAHEVGPSFLVLTTRR
jgi:hypothetical protein